MPDISRIYPDDRQAMEKLDRLLAGEGIRRDANLDYICGIYDDSYSLIATGSCFGNTLRCFAVDHDHRGEGLLNTIVSHLMDYQQMCGNSHLFLYTKCSSARFFRDLGFYEIARVENSVAFMENQRKGFAGCLERFRRETDMANGDLARKGGTVAAIVMNANPFTLGHQYLVEKAAGECGLLHLFLVSEDASLVPFAVREHLVREGTRHMENVILHASGPYIISQATFPSYFQKDDDDVSRSHALLDVTVFGMIAKELGITCRYVGEEPFSQVTGIYNQVMEEQLPKAGIECIVVPRRQRNGTAISASGVRELLKKGDFHALADLVPPATLEYFRCKEAGPVLENIRRAGNVVHH
ncbi:MAG: [Selenomonadaceae bacterium]|nr:[citrate (pro-3S)-lyase] ligase [Selenomonadaceae bacterium]